MPTTPTRIPLVDAVRRAIRESGMSFNELGRLAGVSPGQLSRFAAGSRDVTLAVTSRVCLVLGFELVRTGEPVPDPLPDPPPSNRKRPSDRPPPASAFTRGQGRRVDLEQRGGVKAADTDPERHAGATGGTNPTKGHGRQKNGPTRGRARKSGSRGKKTGRG